MTQTNPVSVPMRILVVDDHPIVRVGIAAIIQARADMAVVGQAGTGEEAIALHQNHDPDLTLMDLRLPDMSGVQVIRRIRDRSSRARFVVLTTYEGDEDIHQALTAGAQGYLIKGMPHEFLIDAIRKVHGGHRFLPPPVSRALASRVPEAELSSREREVLALLVKGKSNKQIAALLQISEPTVKSHVSAILMRLDVADRTQAVVTALQRGLAHL
jgi:DNA-binding NarL/FixJ family response regulator